MFAVLNGKAVDHGRLLFVGRIVAAINVDWPDLYQRARSPLSCECVMETVSTAWPNFSSDESVWRMTLPNLTR
jgi:hypothetical protein